MYDYVKEILKKLATIEPKHIRNGNAILKHMVENRRHGNKDDKRR